MGGTGSPKKSSFGTTSHAAMARRFERAADDLDRASAHLRTAARHMRDRDVPRACAHALASRGHALTAAEALDEIARIHASKAVP